MFKKRRIIIFSLLAVFVLINAVYIAAKDKFFHRLAAYKLEAYLEGKYGVKLFIGDVRGSLLRNLYFNNVKIEDIKGFPEGLAIIIKEAELRYGPKELLRHNPRVEINGAEILYKDLRFPVEFRARGALITLRLEERVFDLGLIRKIFSGMDPDLRLEGAATIKAETILEDFKPKSFMAEVIADSSKISYGNNMGANILLRLNLEGKKDSAKLTGNVYIEDARYYGEVIGLKFKQLPLSILPSSLTMDITIKGNYIRVRNESLDALAKVNLKLLKEPQKAPYLLGRLEADKGTYTVLYNNFKLTHAEIFFVGPSGREIRMDISGQTKVRRYRISASVKGAFYNSYLELHSDPYLSRNEIFSLLLFGKRIEGLSLAEEEELFKVGDVTTTFVNKFFLGRAEAMIAEAIGVDDLNVEADLRPRNESQGFQMPSVEVGKYLDADRVYGTYKIAPDQTPGQKPKQVMAGEYNVTDNLTVKGERSFQESIKLPQEDKVSVKFKWKF